MKRFFVGIIAILACISSLTAQKKLPPLDQLARINDSIIAEGHKLYLFESINWNSTDFLFENHTENEIGESLTYFEDSLIISLFCDTEIENSICEMRWDIHGGSISEQKLNKIRPLTDKEKAEIKRKSILLDKAVSAYGDSLLFIPFEKGQPNIDIIRISDKITRLYFVQGITFSGAIPFGNDYSVDFDNEDNIMAFRRYHRSFIPIYIEQGKEKDVIMPIHTHLEDNPFITPTDICNFLLYGRTFFKLTSFGVVSAAYNCTFIYNDNMKNIITVTD